MYIRLIPALLSDSSFYFWRAKDKEGHIMVTMYKNADVLNKCSKYQWLWSVCRNYLLVAYLEIHLQIGYRYYE